MSASKFDVAKVREMLAKATPGPWRNNPGGCCERIDSGYGFRVIDGDGFRYSDGNVRGNVDLIAATPTLLAAACDRIEKLERRMEGAEQLNRDFIEAWDDYELNPSLVMAYRNAGKSYRDVFADADDAEVK